MIIKKINSSLLNKETRLNSGYFLNEDALNSRLIEENKNKCVILKDIADVWNPPIFKRQYCKESDTSIPYCKSGDVTNVQNGSDIFINRLQAEKLQLIVKRHQVLVTGFGTIGNAKFIGDNPEEVCFANNVCRIEAFNDELSGYIYAFMMSKYGKSQVNKNASGSVVRYIEAPGIKETLIPLLKKETVKNINDTILKVSNLREEADNLIVQVQKDIYTALNIDDAKFGHLCLPLERNIENIFTLDSNDISSLTFRARNYSYRKQQIIKILKKKNYSTLKDVLVNSPFYGSRYKRIESKSKNGIELLSQGNIFDLRPSGRLISKKSLKNIQNEIVSPGTILIPGQGTLGENEIFGKAKFVWGYLENKLVAGHAMRFIPNTEKISSGFLFAILSSKLWFRLLRNSVYGTNLLGFIIPLIESMPVPRFENDFEKDIDDKIKIAYEKLSEALQKETAAIALVEKEIEQWQK